MSEFTADVELSDIAVRDTNVSAALDEPLRAMILDLLADEALTVAAIHDDLATRGFDRTENTVRHHVNELRDAGLVEVARLEERQGATTKYYRANTVVLSYSLPESSERVVDEMAGRIEPQVADLVATLRDEYADELDAIAAEMAPCQHCRNQKYETYLLLTVLRRAFARAETYSTMSTTS
ncbi:ArsR/SmtB family transcription factor [Haloplanus aerogenes]|uniref:ArsR family transcriptional regulator n=1 Tax=Haloplanus aerogenes TaxID=660522 RepID=A0A3M0DXS5_9EURY|nr:winged helix-turn-helix domain-containing protein [Haloplanus aerogenes]AZH24310.1 ArsR family transcriptional regulator [Haloplanus aerogenes]RMB24056.1 helix-turn-helix protein [Haloplanus aerogenes]